MPPRGNTTCHIIRPAIAEALVPGASHRSAAQHNPRGASLIARPKYFESPPSTNSSPHRRQPTEPFLVSDGREAVGVALLAKTAPRTNCGLRPGPPPSASRQHRIEATQVDGQCAGEFMGLTLPNEHCIRAAKSALPWSPKLVDQLAIAD